MAEKTGKDLNYLELGWYYATTRWLFILGWIIVGTAFCVLLYLDAHFSYSLFKGSEINAWAAVFLGAAFRLLAAYFLAASERSRIRGNRKGKVWRRIGIAVSVLVCLHALGIGLEALDGKRDQALADNETASASVEVSNDVVAQLNAQADKIRADTTETLGKLQASIDAILTDNLDNDEDADPYREQQDAAIKSRDERIAKIDAAVIEEIRSGGASRIEAAETEATSDEWAPLFVGLAQVVTWSQKPSDWWIYVCAVIFIAFWVAVAESICIFLPKELYALHLADAERVLEESKDIERLQAEFDEKLKSRLAEQEASIEAQIERALADQAEEFDERWADREVELESKLAQHRSDNLSRLAGITAERDELSAKVDELEAKLANRPAWENNLNIANEANRFYNDNLLDIEIDLQTGMLFDIATEAAG